MTTLTCLRCGAVDTGVFCSSCGTELEPKEGYRHAAGEIVKPFHEMTYIFRHLLSPQSLVEAIELRRLTMRDAVKFYLTAVVISGFAQYLAGSPPPPTDAGQVLAIKMVEVYSIPILGDILRLIGFLAFVLLWLFPTSYLLARNRPKREFKHLLILVTCVTAPFLPLSFLASYMTVNYGMIAAVLWAINIAGFVYICAFIATFYRRTVIGTVLMGLLSSFVLGIALGILLVLGIILYSFFTL